VGNIALQATTIQMYTTLRRLNIPIILALDICFVNKLPSVWIFLSAILTVVGAWLVLLSDTTEFWACSLVISYNLINILNSALTSHYGHSLGLTSWGLMYCNNIVFLPIIFCATIYTDGIMFQRLIIPTNWWPFVPDFILSSLLTFVINFVLYYNASRNGPSSNVVCVSLRDFLITGSSFLALNGCDSLELGLLGNCFGLFSCLIYSVAKLNEK